MTTPQLENGYTSTANELVEAECKVKMSGQEWQVYNAIKRKTYGWNKKVDRIAYSQLAELTGLTRNRVFEAVQSLIKRKMVISRENGTHTPQTLGIQKDFSNWKVYRKNGISRKNGTGCTGKTVQNYPDKTGPQKKENKVKEKTYPPKAAPSEAIELAKRLGRHIYTANPQNRYLQNGTREKTFERWALEIDRAIRIDGRTPKEMETVIDWAHQDGFWYKNILSGEKLRKQFDTLKLNMDEYKKKTGSGQHGSMPDLR